MTFNESTGRWFDKLAEHSANNAGANLDLLLAAAQQRPVKANLDKVRNLAATITDRRLRALLLNTIGQLDRNQFKGEFKFKFHTYPKHGGQVSACSSLFSQIRQAIEYHNAIPRATK